MLGKQNFQYFSYSNHLINKNKHIWYNSMSMFAVELLDLQNMHSDIRKRLYRLTIPSRFRFIIWLLFELLNRTRLAAEHYTLLGKNPSIYLYRHGMCYYLNYVVVSILQSIIQRLLILIAHRMLKYCW